MPSFGSGADAISSGEFCANARRRLGSVVQLNEPTLVFERRSLRVPPDQRALRQTNDRRRDRNATCRRRATDAARISCACTSSASGAVSSERGDIAGLTPAMVFHRAGMSAD
jgi:hypothetical protein